MKKLFIFAALLAASVAATSCAKAAEKSEQVAETLSEQAEEVSDLGAEVSEQAAEAGDAIEEAVRTNADAATEAAVETTEKITEKVKEVAGGVEELTNDNAYRPDTKVKQLTVLDFNATWCGPCKMLAPVFDATAKQFGGKVKFVSIDIDKLPETAQAFRIEAVPTVVLLKPDGKAIRYVGTQDLLPATKFAKIITDNL